MEDTKKLDIVYKKLIYNKGCSSTAVGKPAFIEPYSPIKIDANNVLVELSDIHTSKPTSFVNGDKFDKLNNKTTDDSVAIIQYFEEQATRYTSEYNVYKLPSGGLIPTNIANGVYTAKLFNGVTEIPFNTNTYVDNDSGLITFYDRTFSGVDNITVKGWRYIGKTLANASGGVTLDKRDIPLQTDGVLPTGLSWDGISNYFTYTHNFGSMDYLHAVYKSDTNQLLTSDIIKHTNYIKVKFDFTVLASNNIRLSVKHMIVS